MDKDANVLREDVYAEARGHTVHNEAFDCLGDGLFCLNRKCRVTHVNPAGAALLQAPQEELAGKHVLEILPEPIRLKLMIKFTEALNGKSEASFEEEFPGTPPRLLNCRCVPSGDGITVILRDVSLQHRPEEAFQGAQERERSLLQAMNKGIIEYDGKGVFISANKAARDILGLDFEGMEGLTTQEILSLLPESSAGTTPTYRALELALVHPRLIRKPLTGQKVRILNPRENRFVWVLIDSIPLFGLGEDGPSRIFTILTDITGLMATQESLKGHNTKLERKVKALSVELADVKRLMAERIKQLTEDLDSRKSMERRVLPLATSIDHAVEGLVLFDAGWTIEYMNPAFEGFVGCMKDDLIGKDVHFLNKVIGNDFSAGIPCHIASRGEVWNGIVKRKRGSGDCIDLNLTVSPVRDNTGELMNYVVVIRDASLPGEFHQMRLQSQKMEAIGILASGIAHDLKNIFTPIVMNTEMVLEDTGEDDQDYPLLKDTLEAARLGVDLVRQIKVFTRPSSEEMSPVDISSVVSEALSLLRATIPRTIDICTRIEVKGAKICGNPTQIKQVLMNLGCNAAHAMMGQQGTLEVSLCSIDLDGDETLRASSEPLSGSYVELGVRDTGRGIDECTLQRIFDPFFTTKQSSEGSGIGLSVVQGIVRNHNGMISVQSKQGEGSLFKVLLPCIDTASPEKAEHLH